MRAFVGDVDPERIRPAVYDLSVAQRDLLDVGVITLDRLGNIVFYNRCEGDHARRSPEDSIGRNFFDIAPCARVDTFRGRFKRFAAIDANGYESFWFTYPFRWGAREVDIVFCRRQGHGFIDMITTTRGLRSLESITHESDIAARVVRLNRGRSKRYRPIEEDAVWREDLGTGALSWSPELYDICELARAEPIPAAGIVAFAHPDDVAEVKAITRSATLARAPFAFEHRILTARGNERVVAVRGTVVVDESTGALVVNGRVIDKTAQRLEDDGLWRLANIDRLTNIANRLRFETVLESALDDTQNIGRNLAIIFVDLDRFKPINDTFGHLAGDEVLRQVASRLGACMRMQDLVARLGADEFAILITDYRSEADIEALCKRLEATFDKPFLVGGHPLPVFASIGASSFPRDGNDAKSLLGAAEIAMHESKASGSQSTVRFDVESDRIRRAGTSLENDLVFALVRDQFEMYFQPIVDCSTCAVVGAESLLRWNHPTRGLIAPNDFIPITEANGTILSIGAWVLDEACVWIRRTMDAKKPMPIAVNVSLVQFRSGGFVRSVRESLERSGVSPHLLVLELTESFASVKFDETVAILDALKGLGVTLAIDDFGTGYSSLAYLKRFPVDAIKLDRAFVADIATGPLDRAIADTILRLAEKLDLDVVAEGVETEEQARCMRELGCDRLQGYLFGRPLPASEFFGKPL